MKPNGKTIRAPNMGGVIVLLSQYTIILSIKFNFHGAHREMWVVIYCLR